MIHSYSFPDLPSQKAEIKNWSWIRNHSTSLLNSVFLDWAKSQPSPNSVWVASSGYLLSPVCVKIAQMSWLIPAKGEASRSSWVHKSCTHAMSRWIIYTGHRWHLKEVPYHHSHMTLGTLWFCLFLIHSLSRAMASFYSVSPVKHLYSFQQSMKQVVPKPYKQK